MNVSERYDKDKKKVKETNTSITIKQFIFDFFIIEFEQHKEICLQRTSFLLLYFVYKVEKLHTNERNCVCRFCTSHSLAFSRNAVIYNKIISVVFLFAN